MAFGRRRSGVRLNFREDDRFKVSPPEYETAKRRRTRIRQHRRVTTLILPRFPKESTRRIECGWARIISVRDRPEPLLTSSEQLTAEFAAGVPLDHRKGGVAMPISTR